MSAAMKIPTQQAFRPQNDQGTFPPQEYPAKKARQAVIVLDTKGKRAMYFGIVGGAILAGILLVIITMLYA